MIDCFCIIYSDLILFLNITSELMLMDSIICTDYCISHLWKVYVLITHALHVTQAGIGNKCKLIFCLAK